MYAFYQKHEKLLIAVFVLLIQLSVVPFLNGRIWIRTITRTLSGCWI